MDVNDQSKDVVIDALINANDPVVAPLQRHDYATKGQLPFFNRRGHSNGFVTTRTHICMGCGRPGGTLERLFPKQRRNRDFTAYTHSEHRGESFQKAEALIREHQDEMVQSDAA